MNINQLFLASVLLILIILLGISGTDMHGIKKYDCSISEISPDYPVEVKDACRRIRAEKRKE
jgi:hypothetical protein